MYADETSRVEPLLELGDSRIDDEGFVRSDSVGKFVSGLKMTNARKLYELNALAHSGGNALRERGDVRAKCRRQLLDYSSNLRGGAGSTQPLDFVERAIELFRLDRLQQIVD